MAREVQVTQAGFERLQKALADAQQRREEVIRELSASLDDAMDLEDRSLEAAQHDTTSLDARIAELEDTLARAVVVENHEPDGQVALGSVVVLVNDDRELRVQLVSNVEVSTLDEGITRVADDSPVGQELLGRRVGESFEVELGGHAKRYTVKSVDDDAPPLAP